MNLSLLLSLLVGIGWMEQSPEEEEEDDDGEDASDAVTTCDDNKRSRSKEWL